MRGSIVMLLLLTSLGGCAAQQASDPRTQALLAEPPPTEELRQECSGASTGDMYRYCLEVGPEEALRNDPAMNGRSAAALKAD
jgi:hypothetical protein